MYKDTNILIYFNVRKLLTLWSKPKFCWILNQKYNQRNRRHRSTK